MVGQYPHRPTYSDSLRLAAAERTTPDHWGISETQNALALRHQRPGSDGSGRHLRLSARLIFSDNGMDALRDVKRMHQLRRSFAKSWRNARWRDMLSAFLWWLVGGRSEFELPVSHRERMVLALPTVSFTSPVSVLHVGEEPLDEDDPDVELDDRDESEEDITL